MSAAAPSASTVMPALSTRPPRPARALVAVAVLAGVTSMAGIWTYLGPYTATYFTVTYPPYVDSNFSVPWNLDVQADTRADAIRSLGPSPYTSIAGPFLMEVDRSSDRTGAAIQIGILAALFAYVALYLLGFSARFRRVEPWLAYAEAEYGRRYGATTRAKAGSLLLVAAGAIASGLLALALAWAFTATATSLRSWDWTYWTATRLAAVAGLLLLLAVASAGILAAIAIVVRRARISRGVGSFLVGYGGLLAALWVQNLASIWSSCGSAPSLPGNGASTPVACFVAEVSRQWFPVGVVALFATIPAVGALLVYRDYRRRRAAPSEPRVTHAVA